MVYIYMMNVCQFGTYVIVFFPIVIMPSRVTELKSPDLMLEDAPMRVKKAKALSQTSDEFLAHSSSSAHDNLEEDEADEEEAMEDSDEKEVHNIEAEEESDNVIDEVEEEGVDSEIDDNDDSDDIEKLSDDETGTEVEIRPAHRTADEMLTDNLLV